VVVEAAATAVEAVAAVVSPGGKFKLKELAMAGLGSVRVRLGRTKNKS
jgi:hypothetical protein